MFSFFATLCRVREANKKPYVNEEHTTQRPEFSDYAIVSSIHPSENFLSIVQMAQVLGYSLKKVANNFDRVLILHKSLSISKDDLAILKSVFTHLITLPDLIPKCKNKVDHIQLQHQFFKWHSLNLTRYQKILYVSPNTIFVSTPSLLFKNVVPFSVPNFFDWNTSIYGAIPNLNFVGVSPNKTILSHVLNTFCNIFDYYSIEIKRETYENPGDFTFQTYLYGNITIIPYFNNFQIPGPKSDIINNISRIDDPRIVSVSFQRNHEPWFDDNIFSNLWYNYANKLRAKYLSNATLMVHNSTQYLKNEYKDHKIRSKEEIYACSKEFEMPNFQRIIINSLLIILISFGFLGFSITFRKLPYYNWQFVVDFFIEFFTL